jgi:hypothetical protein
MDQDANEANGAPTCTRCNGREPCNYKGGHVHDMSATCTGYVIPHAPSQVHNHSSCSGTLHRPDDPTCIQVQTFVIALQVGTRRCWHTGGCNSCIPGAASLLGSKVHKAASVPHTSMAVSTLTAHVLKYTTSQTNHSQCATHTQLYKQTIAQKHAANKYACCHYAHNELPYHPQKLSYRPVSPQ